MFMREGFPVEKIERIDMTEMPATADVQRIVDQLESQIIQRRQHLVNNDALCQRLTGQLMVYRDVLLPKPIGAGVNGDPMLSVQTAEEEQGASDA